MYPWYSDLEGLERIAMCLLMLSSAFLMLFKLCLGMVVFFRYRLSRHAFEVYCITSFVHSASDLFRGMLWVMWLFHWMRLVTLLLAIPVYSYFLQMDFCYMAKLETDYRFDRTIGAIKSAQRDSER